MEDRELVVLCSCLSIAASLVIVLAWAAFSELQFFSRKLIVYLASADIAAAAGFALSQWTDGGSGALGAGSEPSGALCQVQGVLVQFAFTASYCWTAVFAYHLFQLIIRKQVHPERAARYYHGCAWGIPLCVLLYVYLRKDVGFGNASRPWCWIASVEAHDGEYDSEGAWTQMSAFLVPVASLFLFNALLYVTMAQRVRANAMGRSIRVRLVMYALVFVLTCGWGVVNRAKTLQSTTHQVHSHAFTYRMEIIFTPLTGLLNALAYGVNSVVLESFRKACCGVRRERPHGGLAYEDDETSDDTMSYTTDDRGAYATPLADSADVATGLLVNGNGSPAVYRA